METFTTVDFFTLKSKTFKAKAVKIHDGDTIHAVFKFNGEYTKFKIRLAEIDCPKVRTKNKVEKEAGLKAKDFLISLLRDDWFTLKCGDFCKYGRLLGYIYVGDVCVNEMMVKNGHAYEYHGDKKIEFENWYKLKE